MNDFPVACDILSFTEQKTFCEDEFMILFLLEGEIGLSVRDAYFPEKTYQSTLAAMDVAVLSPMRQANIMPTIRNMVLRIRIKPTFLYQAFGSDFIEIKCNSALIEGDYSDLCRQIASVYDAYGLAPMGGNLHLFSALYSMLGTIHDHFTVFYIPDAAQEADTDARVREIAYYIRSHYREPLTLQTVSDHMNLSPQYFSRFFKRYFGIGFVKYLTRLRLDYVCIDLRTTEKQITQIAFDNGFTNLNSFGRAFQENLGMTPREYRSRQKEEKEDFRIRDGLEGSLHVQTYLKGPNGQNFDRSEAAVNRFSDEADCSASVSIPDTWRDCINLHRAKNCLMVEFQNQVQEVQQKLGFRYARINNVFDAEMVSLDQNHIMCGFSGFVRVVDFFREVGLCPFLDISLRPLRVDITSDISYEMKKVCYSYTDEEWKSLLEQFLSSCIERWGAEYLSAWRFELCFDHESGSVERYTERYLLTQDIFDCLLPDAKLGGPGFDLSAMELNLGIRQMRSLSSAGAHPDFISVASFPNRVNNVEEPDEESAYEYKIRLVSIIYGADSQPKRETLQKLRTAIDDIFPYHPKLYIVEYSCSWSSRTQLNDTVYKNAFLIRTAIECAGAVDGMAYWYFSDLACEEDTSSKPLFGGNGIVTRDGLKKGSYYAFWFLSRLGSRGIHRGDNYLLCSSGPNRYEIVVHNIKRWRQDYCMHYFRELEGIDDSLIFEDLEDMEWQLNLQNLEPGQYLIRHSLINQRTGDLATEVSQLYLKGYLQKDDVEYLTHMSVPRQHHSISFSGDGKLAVKAHLLPNEIRLITVTRIGA